MTLDLTEAQCREISRLRASAPDVPCAIIGAVALNHHVPLPRSTSDVDLVLALDIPHLRELLERLGWEQHPKKGQRWTAPGFVADVLPASQELLEAGKVALDDDEREMSLAGFDLLYKHARRERLPHGGDRVLVASLPTIVVLKICAWLDSPYDRKKDLHDLGTILAHSLGEVDERRWKEPLSDLNFEEQGPYLVGLQVGRIILDHHGQLLEKFLAILLNDESHWQVEVAHGFGSRTVDPRTAVEAFGAGLRNRISK